MAVEIERRRHSLKIPVPDNDDLAFYVWVTDAITFVREDGIGQEIRLTMDSWPGPTGRMVTPKEIETGEGNEPFKVEYLLGTATEEEQGNGQEARWSFLSDPSSHYRTREVVIKARKESGEEDDSCTLTITKVDVLHVEDESGIGQEAFWTLDNQDDEDQIDFSAPDDTYNDGLGPIRLDWFQAITEAKLASYVMAMEICNVNSARDDIFDLYVNGEMAIHLDFSPDHEMTTFVIEVGNVDKFYHPQGVVRGTKKYTSFGKSPFKFESNTLDFNNLATSNNGNYFEVLTVVWKPDGTEVYRNLLWLSGSDGENFNERIDLSSLKSGKPTTQIMPRIIGNPQDGNLRNK